MVTESANPPNEALVGNPLLSVDEKDQKDEKGKKESELSSFSGDNNGNTAQEIAVLSSAVDTQENDNDSDGNGNGDGDEESSAVLATAEGIIASAAASAPENGSAANSATTAEVTPGEVVGW